MDDLLTGTQIQAAMETPPFFFLKETTILIIARVILMLLYIRHCFKYRVYLSHKNFTRRVHCERHFVGVEIEAQSN